MAQGEGESRHALPHYLGHRRRLRERVLSGDLDRLAEYEIVECMLTFAISRRDVKPLAKTASCQAPHFQYHLAGRLAIKMDDGTEYHSGPGDVTVLPSGHDAWVVGKDPVVIVDGQGTVNYAKR